MIAKTLDFVTSVSGHPNLNIFSFNCSYCTEDDLVATMIIFLALVDVNWTFNHTTFHCMVVNAKLMNSVLKLKKLN